MGGAFMKVWALHEMLTVVVDWKLSCRASVLVRGVIPAERTYADVRGDDPQECTLAEELDELAIDDLMGPEFLEDRVEEDIGFLGFAAIQFLTDEEMSGVVVDGGHPVLVDVSLNPTSEP